MRKRVKRIITGVAAVAAAILVVAGTYAWFHAKDYVDNQFGIGFGQVKIVEVFTPTDSWTPGQTVDKQMSAINTGTQPMFARIRFEEAVHLLNMPGKAYQNPDAPGTVPQLVNPDAYAKGPWGSAAAAGLAVQGLPAEVELLVNKNVSAAGTPAEKTTYSFVTVRKLAGGAFDGRRQRVAADFALDGDTVTVQNLRYWAYDGYTVQTTDWGQAPPKSADIGLARADAGGKINLLYSEPVPLAAPTPTDGKWWYNSRDGYFYYIGILAEGVISPRLLNGVKLAVDAPDAYAGMQFQLTVHMDAIQNSRDALTANTGWNLPNDSPLVQALAPYCA